MLPFPLSYQARLFPPHWLYELHSKIWNREDREPELFRKVKVSRAHYDALQALLNGKYSDRDRPEYKGDNDDVTRYKLDILKSITKEAASPQHTDNNEVEVNDDDDDDDGDDDEAIDSLFPFTLRFLDLVSLPLVRTPVRFCSPLLIREEYDEISKLIEGYPKGGRGSVIITGQPGTGEFLISLSRRI